MAVPATINDISQTPASNAPAGSDSVFPLLDDYLRTGFSFIAVLRDTKLASSSVSSFVLPILASADGAAFRVAIGAADASTVALKGANNDITSLGALATVPSVVSGEIAASVAAIQTQHPGEICFFARSTAPAGFLKANGALVSRTTYSALFSAIGTTFGAGDGVNTFNLPDLRGEFVRGLDDGRGVDTARALGSAQADELRAHTHQFYASDISNGAYQGPDVERLGGFQAQGYTTSSTGGAETRPRNIALLACIKY